MPSAVLWGAGVDLSEDVFRSGMKNSSAVDYLRWSDLGFNDRPGRIAESDLEGQMIEPGRGISMFIKKLVPSNLSWICAGPVTGSQEKQLKKEFPTIRETFGGSWKKGKFCRSA